jgi:hypothetical protein
MCEAGSFLQELWKYALHDWNNDAGKSLESDMKLKRVVAKAEDDFREHLSTCLDCREKVL